jgi:hypothetical protein
MRSGRMTRNLLSYAKAFSSGQRHRLEYAIFGKRIVAGPKRSSCARAAMSIIPVLTTLDGSQVCRARPNLLRGANTFVMDSGKKDEPVTYEKEAIVPLDPAHEEKPTLVERERIEKEQVKKEENQPIFHEEEGGCPLPDEEDKEPARKGA